MQYSKHAFHKTMSTEPTLNLHGQTRVFMRTQRPGAPKCLPMSNSDAMNCIHCLYSDAAMRYNVPLLCMKQYDLWINGLPPAQRNAVCSHTDWGGPVAIVYWIPTVRHTCALSLGISFNERDILK